MKKCHVFQRNAVSKSANVTASMVPLNRVPATLLLAAICLPVVFATGCKIRDHLSIEQPAPPTLPANQPTIPASPSAKQVQLPDYTAMQYQADLKNYADVDADSNNKNLDKARVIRDRIVHNKMSAINVSYNKYHALLFGDQALINTSGDALSLGATATATIATNPATKTIMSALGTAFTGLSLSVSKNYFGQQSFQILSLAMDTARRRIGTVIELDLNTCNVKEYPLSKALEDTQGYFAAGSLPSALQELQLEAQAASAQTKVQTGAAGAQVIPPPPPPQSDCGLTTPAQPEAAKQTEEKKADAKTAPNADTPSTQTNPAPTGKDTPAKPPPEKTDVQPKKPASLDPTSNSEKKTVPPKGFPLPIQ